MPEPPVPPPTPVHHRINVGPSIFATYEPLLERRVDLLWSAAPVPFGGYARGDGSAAVSGAIVNGTALTRHAYARFGERNSGTVLAVRRSAATRAWLEDALRIYPKQLAAGFVAGAGGRADQPALREAAFLHREAIREQLLPPAVACRGADARGPCGVAGPFRRYRRCLFLHTRAPAQCHCAP